MQGTKIIAILLNKFLYIFQRWLKYIASLCYGKNFYLSGRNEGVAVSNKF